MMPVAPPLPEGLDALDDALRRAVAAETDVVLGAARADADAVVHDARRQGEELVERAGRDATAITDAAMAHELVALHREQNATVLLAKRALMDELEEQVHDAVLRLRDAHDYPRLLDGLVGRARAQLGADAVVTRDPPGRGGVIAECDGRRVDYTLPALARRAVADQGDAIDELLQ